MELENRSHQDQGRGCSGCGFGFSHPLTLDDWNTLGPRAAYDQYLFSCRVRHDDV